MIFIVFLSQIFLFLQISLPIFIEGCKVESFLRRGAIHHGRVFFALFMEMSLVQMRRGGEMYRRKIAALVEALRTIVGNTLGVYWVIMLPIRLNIVWSLIVGDILEAWIVLLRNVGPCGDVGDHFGML